MASEYEQAQWTLENGDCVRLTGQWNLLFHTRRRRELRAELGRLDSPRRYRWQLRDVESFDSGGALLLWRLWGAQLPDELDCSDSQQHWFDRLRATVAPSHPGQTHFFVTMDRISHRGVAIAAAIGGLLLLLGQLILDAGQVIRNPRLMPWKEVSATIYRAGATSMLLLGIVGFLIGVVMTIQIAMTLKQFNAAHMVIPLMGLAILRELGSVIAALILAGRSGSAMTAGVGAMHITEEFNALRAFGASPSLRLVLPRVLGMTISVPLLVVWSDFTGLLGAALASDAFLDVNWQLFLARLPEAVPIINFWIGIGKGVLFGFIISWVATYFALTAHANTESLSRHTTLSVVTSLSLILVVDALAGAFMTNLGL